MNLSRKWLNEFVDGVSVSDIDDKEFSEAMTLSGSKVETYERLDAEIRNGKNEKWLKKAMVLKAMHPSYELTIYHMVMINV